MNTDKLIIFFDGWCPLCRKDVDFLESRNQKENLKFIDIISSDLWLESKYGITYKESMERIHSVKGDGSLIKDISVFREAYNLIDLGWIYASQKFPIVNRLTEFIYKLLAKYRFKRTYLTSIENLCDSKGFDFSRLEWYRDYVRSIFK